VLARAAPEENDQDYFYVSGDARKFPGFYNQSEFVSNATDAEAMLLLQGLAMGRDNWDLQGCTPLLNADEMRGAVCLVVRGGCFFSTKTLNCQVGAGGGAFRLDDDVHRAT
jgi:hypothetical protein